MLSWKGFVGRANDISGGFIIDQKFARHIISLVHEVEVSIKSLDKASRTNQFHYNYSPLKHRLQVLKGEVSE